MWSNGTKSELLSWMKKKPSADVALSMSDYVTEHLGSSRDLLTDTTKCIVSLKIWSTNSVFSVNLNLLGDRRTFIYEGCKLKAARESSLKLLDLYDTKQYMLSWHEADILCKQQNMSLPSFMSRNEVISFIRFWYPFRTPTRIYEELAVYINLNSKVQYLCVIH